MTLSFFIFYLSIASFLRNLNFKYCMRDSRDGNTIGDSKGRYTPMEKDKEKK